LVVIIQTCGGDALAEDWDVRKSGLWSFDIFQESPRPEKDVDFEMPLWEIVVGFIVHKSWEVFM
jgi:hypothetical protein